MPDVSIANPCPKIGDDYINYYRELNNDLYLYFSGTYCHNCKSIEQMLKDNANIKYLKITIDDDETDEYMDYLESLIGEIKIPTLIKIVDGDITEKCIGEEKCKHELYSIDDICDDF
tara:strand:+ start:465 stop:815 length:351 start_codon:yes stop_codon:yes gene_type:complete